MLDVEDEVDWSDGTINSPPEIPETPPPAASEELLEECSDPVKVSPDSPLQQPFPARHRDGGSSNGSPGYLLDLIIDGLQDSKPATQPLVADTSTKEDTAVSALSYLANAHPTNFNLPKLDKKTYDAAFLKKYVADALNPHTLDLKKRLPGSSTEEFLQLERYLRTVRDNVNIITDGIVWNARPNELTAEKPVDALRPDNLPTVSPRKKPAGVWRPNNYDDISLPERPSKVTVHAPRPTHPRPKQVHRGRSQHVQQSNSNPGGAPTLLETLVAQSGSDNIMGGHPASDDVCRLEQLVAQSGPEIIACAPSASHAASGLEQRVGTAGQEQTASRLRGTSRDRAAAQRLIDNHLERGARKFGCLVEYPESRDPTPEPQDIETVVKIAVANGIVMPPSPGTQEKIAERARRQRAEWAAAAAAEQERLEQAALAQQEEIRELTRDPVDLHADYQYPGYMAAAGYAPINTSSMAGKKQKLGARAPGVSVKPRVVSGTPVTKRTYRKKNAAYWSTKPSASFVVEGQGKRAASPLTEQQRKRQRTTDGISLEGRKRKAKVEDNQPLPPHPSGSKMLEAYQILPPDAYFEKKNPDEKPVWRCQIQHALGYYYNSGDRKSCRGCNTNVAAAAQKLMDFYMPHSTVFYQPSPNTRPWLPNAPSANPKKTKSFCHNSIAKDAFWEARNGGASEEDARATAVAYLTEYLRPKPKPEPEPSSAPSPEPEPIDLGPHPSGSQTMEHGQEIPACAYFARKERHEAPAWRCDGAHAFGRYYMAGDKRTCPGCGLCKTGTGRRVEMDFYMPAGAVIRQETAAELMVWKPKRPYRCKKKAVRPQTLYSHNQMVAAEFWRGVDGGVGEEEALRVALENVDRALDARYGGVEGEGEGAGEEEEEMEKLPKNKGTGRKMKEKQDAVEADTKTGVLLGPEEEEGDKWHPVTQQIFQEPVGDGFAGGIEVSSGEEEPSSSSDSE